MQTDVSMPRHGVDEDFAALAPMNFGYWTQPHRWTSGLVEGYDTATKQIERVSYSYGFCHPDGYWCKTFLGFHSPMAVLPVWMGSPSVLVKWLAGD
jgi:hypothetical protein